MNDAAGDVDNAADVMMEASNCDAAVVAAAVVVVAAAVVSAIRDLHHRFLPPARDPDFQNLWINAP